MQLDQNRIVIRERSYVDILDLALRVIRLHAWPLAVAFGCGVVPAACVNAWLLAGYAGYGFEIGIPLRYMAYMSLLVLAEVPLVGAPLTLYLGEALFTDRPRPAEIARRFFRALPQLLVFQLLPRSVLIPLAFSWLLLGSSLEAYAAVTGFLLLLVWLVWSVAWPYLGEVILLERNPIRGKVPGQMTTNRRRRLLHAGYASELFACWLGSLGVGVLLFSSVWLSLWLADGLLLNDWSLLGSPSTVCLPLALWLVVGYFTVVRFLSYVDLRIRREGWEVELMIRAEQARLTRQLT